MSPRRATFQPSLLRHRSDIPLHVQLYERIRQSILVGTLPPGTRLPSARAMALEVHVARGTVDVAYARLAVEGFLITRGAAGTFVTSPLPLSPRGGTTVAPQPRSEPRARTVLWPFQIGVPAVDAFPIATWARVLGRHSRRVRASELAYSSPTGDASLREAIAAHLAVSRGVVAHANEVMITGGYHATLGLLAHALSKPEDPVWMEDPGYFRARHAFVFAGLRPVAVPVDAEGLDVSRGVALAPRARFAVVTPGHQMPLGMALSLPRRLALLDWARSADAWIVEDDYDGEFHYDSAPLPALKSLDDKGLVLYAGTFSKSMFPSVRLGFLVVPERAREALARAASLLHPAPPLAIQRAAADFLGEGHFARHVRRVRSLYAERRAALLRALAELSSPHLQIGNAPGGLHLLARLRGIRDDAVVNHADGLGLAPGALSAHQFNPAKNRLDGLLLGFATLPAAQARDAVSRLARAMELARTAGPGLRAGSG
ncbi:MocR-like pyridoxine biosynthesis transcription factor PdxR [Hyalangium versicolor]|uniref:MocR-like pyridoxine biosynthesis transcription factor PdxR n=1 Tax=Hyalangium versicolor TaxID=2861190 RepID=UPI001CCBA368|nr:PLP-dependent aminotransferase family protein [Hyalangium versicolor]